MFVRVSDPGLTLDVTHPFCLPTLFFAYEVMLCNLEFTSLDFSC